MILTTVRLFSLFAFLSAVHVAAAEEAEDSEKPERTSIKVQNQVPRMWTDRSGEFAVQAALLGISADRIRLRRVDTDKVIVVPLHRLMRQDRVFVAHVRRRLRRGRDSSEHKKASRKEAADEKQVNLTGVWRSANGPVYVLLDNGTSVSVWMKSSSAHDLVDCTLAWQERRLVSTDCSVVFKEDAWRKYESSRLSATVFDDTHLRVRHERVEFNSLGKLVRRSFSGRTTWTKITAAPLGDGDKPAPDAVDEESSGSDESRLRSEISALENQLREAYAEYSGVLAAANRFANLRPPERNSSKALDRANGTPIDGRYADEPAVDLSRASLRYGAIVRDRDACKARFELLVKKIADKKANLARIMSD